MNISFAGFGESARLYAKYKGVVDEMQKVFNADVAIFLDATEERLQKGLDPLRLGREQPGNYRYWWTEDGTDPAGDDTPYVWVNQSDVRLINEGRLRAGVWADGARAEFKQVIQAAVGAVLLPSHCELDASQEWPTVTIKLGDVPIEMIAEPLVLVLRAIGNADRGCPRHSARKAARP